MSEKPEGEVPWPKTEEELLAYIREMLAWPDKTSNEGEGYGRCVYSMSNAALAAFNYVAHQLRVTGFQASCADIQFIVDRRGLKDGCILLNGNDLLYPQYDLRAQLEQWIEGQRTHLAKKAKELLATIDGPVSPDVLAHWEALAKEEG